MPNRAHVNKSLSPNIRSGLRNGTGKKKPIANSQYSIPNFSDDQALGAEAVLEQAVTLYKAGRVKEALDSLLQSQTARDQGLTMTYLDRDLGCGDKALTKIEKDFLAVVKGAGFAPKGRELQLPRVEFKRCFYQFFTMSATKKRIDAAYEQMFLVAIEEWIHFAQFTHGQTLSQKFSHNLFGTAGSFADYSVLEMDIPFILEQWGIPFDRRLIDRYPFREINFCTAFPEHVACARESSSIRSSDL